MVLVYIYIYANIGGIWWYIDGKCYHIIAYMDPIIWVICNQLYNKLLVMIEGILSC